MFSKKLEKQIFFSIQKKTFKGKYDIKSFMGFRTSNLKVDSSSTSRLHICDWFPLEEKNAKRLDIWKGSSMSVAGKTTLINPRLTNTPIYHIYAHLLSQNCG